MVLSMFGTIYILIPKALGMSMLGLNWALLTFSLSAKESSFFFILVLVSLSVFAWARYYMLFNENPSFFFVSLLMFVLSMFLLVLSNSFLSVFLGWEGLGVTSFLLIVFYQNWSSTGGGLLTLLTNRLGDAFLMVGFGIWMMHSTAWTLVGGSLLSFSLLVALSFTKSAQWPFTSWLPAAMAAPTPVSALVHSSTLVTAGVWLLVRFSSLSNLSVSLLLLFSGATIFVASLAALLEMDAKKIVALSTLSQLGLMMLSLAVGGLSVCLFHLLSHALAKANLFMTVGMVLHMFFSQQNKRAMNMTNKVVILSATLSILSLSGLGVLVGTFSKEEILKGHLGSVSSLLSVSFLAMVISLTMAYCYKLIVSMLTINLNMHNSWNVSKSGTSPLLIMSLLLMGFSMVLMDNMDYCFATLSVSTLYTLFLILFPVFMALINVMSGGFYLNEKLTKSSSMMLLWMKKNLLLFNPLTSDSLHLMSVFLMKGDSFLFTKVLFSFMILMTALLLL
uniref:NADH:ubiquinone reductase (H(+)-translocating) n=1 Tax=Paralongidorus litoralis TaxID=474435 RepID=A0A1P8C773_9BILA|nr:NADH dehydrogenase subunit 5 [Paralongidorus litoralis]AOT84251.1 NADH dehydrogenase subunit 5 [Paralongidorus litoralis]